MSDDTRTLSGGEMDAIEAEAEAQIAAARARPVDPAVEARVQELLRRPYRMEVAGDPEEGYLARAPELPGCFTAGETPTEAVAMLRDAMATWLESAVLEGAPIPEPGAASGEQHSGRILLRMPKSLHRALAEAADAEGVSTNQYVVALLAANVGGPVGHTTAPRPAVPAAQPTAAPQRHALGLRLATAVEEAVEAGLERALRRQGSRAESSGLETPPFFKRP